MKRILGVVALIMLVPMTAFSMDAVSDAEMQDITGAGVNIYFDGGDAADAVGGSAVATIEDVTYTDEGSVSFNGTITNTITINNKTSLTIDVSAPATTDTTDVTKGVEIGGLNNVNIGVTMPKSSNIKINGASIGSIGFTSIGVAVTGPQTLVISATN